LQEFSHVVWKICSYGNTEKSIYWKEMTLLNPMKTTWPTTQRARI